MNELPCQEAELKAKKYEGDPLKTLKKVWGAKNM
jgi:hypothetical protein